MGKQLQARNKFSPNLPKVQCRFIPANSAECRFIKKDAKTGAVIVSGYAVKWDSINYYGEKFLKGAFADVCAAFKAGTKKFIVITIMAGVSGMSIRLSRCVSGKLFDLKKIMLVYYLKLN